MPTEDIKVATRYFGTIEKYDEIENWSNYSERMEQFFIMNNIVEQKQKAAVFLSAIGSNAYALLKNLTTPSLPSCKSYEELNKILKDYYEPQPLIIAERFKFHKRDQGEGETVQQFFAELKRLSTTCQFGTFIDEAIRDRFVCGMTNERIQRRLLSETEITAARALSLAITWDHAVLRKEDVNETTVMMVQHGSKKKPRVLGVVKLIIKLRSSFCTYK